MAMRSALYYPYTRIHSENVLKTALLLWDQIHVIVPSGRGRPSYRDKTYAEVFELIGQCHEPSDYQKHQFHELVENFASARLPAPFFYRSRVDCIRHFEISAGKGLPDTWRRLRDCGLLECSLLRNHFTMSHHTGLVLMSLLADCCAGQTLTRVTDEIQAYASLANLFGTKTKRLKDPDLSVQRLSALTVKMMDTNSLSLKRLIDFRKKEVASPDGSSLRALRHRYLERISDQAASLATGQSPWDTKELMRQFQDDMRNDLRELKQELRLTAGETLGEKEILTCFIAGGGAIASQLLNIPIPDVVTAAGGLVSIGGLVALKSKFSKSRDEILKAHPMAYLYELQGGRLKL